MPVAVWPSTCATLRNSIRERLPDNVLRSPMEVGPAKVRRRTTSGVRELTAEVQPLTSAERSTFESFFVTELRYGSLPFTWVHPLTGATLLCRFKEPPQYQEVWAKMGSLTQVSISVEILP